jgi:hypothetical protein
VSPSRLLSAQSEARPCHSLLCLQMRPSSEAACTAGAEAICLRNLCCCPSSHAGCAPAAGAGGHGRRAGGGAPAAGRPQPARPAAAARTAPGAQLPGLWPRWRPGGVHASFCRVLGCGLNNNGFKRTARRVVQSQSKRARWGTTAFAPKSSCSPVNTLPPHPRPPQAPGAQSHGDCGVAHVKRVFGCGQHGLVSRSGMGGSTWV